MKVELGGKIMKICRIKIKKPYSYLADDGSESLQVYRYF